VINFFFLAAGMGEEEGQSNFTFLIFFFLQWIDRRADFHLDSAGRRNYKNSQSTFKSGRVVVVFTRRAVSRIGGFLQIDHLVN
jgi:hypothetical protein